MRGFRVKMADGMRPREKRAVLGRMSASVSDTTNASRKEHGVRAALQPPSTPPPPPLPSGTGTQEEQSPTSVSNNIPGNILHSVSDYVLPCVPLGVS